jgi:hypothetical protein
MLSVTGVAVSCTVARSVSKFRRAVVESIQGVIPLHLLLAALFG